MEFTSMTVDELEARLAQLPDEIEKDGGEAPFAIREGACGLRKWCKLLVLKFDWSSA